MTSETAPEPPAPARPFTARDVARHSTGVWLSAMVAAVVLLQQPSSGLNTTVGFVIYIAIVLLILIWLGAPLAWLLGRVMRNVRPVILHLLAFATLGYAAGSLLVTIAAAVWVQGLADLGSPQVVALGFGCARCVVVGRAAAFALRRSDERRAARASRTDRAVSLSGDPE